MKETQMVQIKEAAESTVTVTPAKDIKVGQVVWDGLHQVWRTVTRIKTFKTRLHLYFGDAVISYANGDQVKVKVTVEGRIYWSAAYDYDDGSRREFSTYIAPDWDAYLTRRADFATHYPGREVIFRWWQKA